MFFDRGIEPSCAYCKFGTSLGFDEIACSKRGIMTGACSCGAFHYEPTKRVPETYPKLKLAGYSEEDFLL